ELLMYDQTNTSLCYIFFFQAEDGIRDASVTGVQTCALPIYTHTPHTHTHININHGRPRILWSSQNEYHMRKTNLLTKHQDTHSSTYTIYTHTHTIYTHTHYPYYIHTHTL